MPCGFRTLALEDGKGVFEKYENCKEELGCV